MESNDYVDSKHKQAVNIADIDLIDFYEQIFNYLQKFGLEVPEENIEKKEHEANYVKYKSKAHDKNQPIYKPILKKKKESSHYLFNNDSSESKFEESHNITDAHEKCKENEFLVDSGSTIHIVNTKVDLFNIRSKRNEPGTIGQKVVSKLVGNYKFSNKLILKDVLYVPTASRNIMSMSKLIKDGYQVSLTDPPILFTTKREVIAKIFHEGDLFKVYGEKLPSTFNIIKRKEDKLINCTYFFGACWFQTVAYCI